MASAPAAGPRLSHSLLAGALSGEAAMSRPEGALGTSGNPGARQRSSGLTSPTCVGERSKPAQ